MEALTVRLLPFEIADGSANMAADEALLHSAAGGVASLRFYGWDRPTVSLGYFQSHAALQADPLLAPLPFVRRPTGGLTLVHHYELTYCLAVPAARPWHQDSCWLRMHEAIGAALGKWRVSVSSCGSGIGDQSSEILCFHHLTPGDLLIDRKKVVGSAQRKQRGAVMQHGAILLGQSPITPTLPGIQELSNVRIDPAELAAKVIRAAKARLGWRVHPGPWTTEERASVEGLVLSRYGCYSWNGKR